MPPAYPARLCAGSPGFGFPLTKIVARPTLAWPAPGRTMQSDKLELKEGEALLKESADNHLLRPGESSVGRLCRAYLTDRRLVFREALYDVAKMREAGLGVVLHEIPLKDVASVRAGVGTTDPSLELEAYGLECRLERSILCFRDRGWHLGEPERRDERDYWLGALRQRLKRLGASAAPPAARPAAPPKPAPAPVTPAGTVIAGKYELLRQIGEGGMGHVFLGKDLSLSRFVALKKLRPELLNLPREMDLFLREARMSAALHHPFIADIYEVLRTDGEVYLVFEFLAGKTLEQLISDKGRLSVREARRALACMCSALAFAHSEGVAHRDLKPSNVILTAQGFAKVTDFGVARHMKDVTSRASHPDNAGTLAYMAPEQELGKFGPRSDLFSLGATAYEMLSGEMPFTGPNFYLQKERMSFPPLSESAPQAPGELRSAVERCLSFDPEKRFAGVEDFARAAGVAEPV